MTTKNFKVKNGIDIGDSIAINGNGNIVGLDTDNLDEGTTNQYFTDARAREAISATDAGGDGSLSYDDNTGVITYTGPSATEVRAHFSGGTGVTITDGSIAIGQAVNTNSNVQFDGITGGSLTVDNININGNTVISTDTNGNITLDPNGTGDVVTSKNIVRGAIRNATADTNGAIWYLNTSSLTAAYSGISVDNSPSTASQTGLVLRNYTGNNTGASIGSRSRVIFEKARNTVASPAAVASGDLLGEVAATGYTSTGWINDQYTFVPAFFGFTAAEPWVANTNLGTSFNLTLAPTATTVTSNANLISVIIATPQAVTFRTDAYNFRTKAGTTSAGDYLSLASTGAIIKNGSNVELANFATGTATISADNIVLQKSNGTDLLQIDSDNATLTTTRLRQVSAGTYGGEIVLKAGILTGATSYDKTTELGVTANTTDGTNQAAFEVKTNRFDGTNYSPTQNNDGLGQFKFNGNYSSSTSPAVNAPAAALECQATENWTSTANGALIALSAIKAGTTNIQQVARYSPEQSIVFTDAYQIKDSNNVLLPGNKIDYSRVYGQFQYNTTVTADDPDTAYVFPLGTADINNIATVGSTSRLIAGAAGIYNLQFSVQVENADNNNDHDAYVWLRKNGFDVTGSMGRTTVTKDNAGSLKIIAWNYIVSSDNTTDYWEIAYAVSDTDVSFPAFASTAFGPSTACIITSLTPVGA